MKTIVMKVSELIHPEKNVRRHPENQIKELLKSIQMFGQIRPVVVDENNVILAGNGMVEALRLGGYEEANVLKMTGLSETDKKKLMIADNRIYALGFDHNDNIFEMLKEIGDFEVPGYDEEMLQNLLADEDDIEEELESYGKLDREEVEQFEEAGERLRYNIENRPYQEPEEVSQDHGDQYDQHSADAQENDSAPSENRTVCPHCGGKGWL